MFAKLRCSGSAPLRRSTVTALEHQEPSTPARAYVDCHLAPQSSGAERSSTPSIKTSDAQKVLPSSRSYACSLSADHAVHGVPRCFGWADFCLLDRHLGLLIHTTKGDWAAGSFMTKALQNRAQPASGTCKGGLCEMCLREENGV